MEVAMLNNKRIAAMLTMVALVAAACGRTGGGPGGADRISHPTGADELVLRVDVGGGFVPVEYNLAAIPGLSVYGDGRMIVTGPAIEIYPGPALPNLQAAQLSEDGLQAILRAARDAGLMNGDASYDYPCVADLPTTTFTVVAEGRRNQISAYALGSDDGTGTCEGVDAAARKDLVTFQTRLGDLERLLPEGSIGPEQPYTPAEMRVFALPYRGQPDLPQEPVEWPIAGPLERFGRPTDTLEGARCGVVEGTDLSESLLPVAVTANQLTPWTSQGGEYSLILRPLLPDEHGC